MARSQEIDPNPYYVDLQARRMTIRSGWDNTIAEQLTKHSLEEEIVKYHIRDSRGRFHNFKTANQWFGNHQPMSIYTLALARTAKLAGSIWIAPPEDHIPNVEFAFNLRVYEDARGRDVAVNFGSAALFDYDRQHPNYEGDIGAKIDRDAVDEIAIHEALGFDRSRKIKSTEQFVTLIRPGLLSRVSHSAGHRRR